MGEDVDRNPYPHLYNAPVDQYVVPSTTREGKSLGVEGSAGQGYHAPRCQANLQHCPFEFSSKV